MKKLLSFIFLAVVSLAAAAQSPLPKALQVSELKLGNGMTVWLNEDHSQPKVFGAVVVRAGAADCPDTGIAHYFEHMLFKGTDRIGTVDYAAERPWLDSISAGYDRLAAATDAAQRAAIQSDINRLSRKAAEYAVPNDFNNLVTLYGGSGLNAATSYDYTYYYNTFSPQYVRQWTALNSERLLRPVFRLFQSELETVYEEKNRLSDDMVASALARITEKVYEGTPYQYLPIGSTANLKNPQLSKMREFYAKYYVASNMGLILAGDICADSIVPVLEATFGRLPEGSPAVAPACSLKPFDCQTYPIKINVPVVSAELLAFQGPVAGSADADVLTLAMRLLNNSNSTGMLDSLMNDSRLLAAIAFNMPQKRVGLAAVGIVPNLLGKKSKAEDLCREEIERLKRGDFSDEALALVKQDYERNRIEEMEDIASRAQLMVEVFGTTDLSWNEYVARSQAIHGITRDDILRVARKYLGDRYLRFVKKYGSYDKDRLMQPGYSPVVPKNIGAQSDFARSLAAMPVQRRAPRFVDVDSCAATRQLAPLAMLYAVPNPVDSLFSLQLVYHRGKCHDQRLDYLADCLGEFGTDSLSFLQLSRRMQQLGAMMSFETADDKFYVRLMGRDSQFAASVGMLAHFLSHVKADDERLRELKKMARVEAKSFGKSPSDVGEALVAKLKYGARSPELMRMPVADVSRLTADDLLDALAGARRAQCSVIYSGTLPADTVAACVGLMLHPEMSVEPRVDVEPPLAGVGENVVYVYQLNDARQNIIGTYQQLAATPEWSDVADQQLFARYFGIGMSSLLFQEMREFRSMAYSVGGYALGPVHARRPADPTAFITTLGTQADKTLQAVALLDSLLSNMPVRRHNIEVAHRSLVNGINSAYPGFRSMGERIADMRLDGYSRDRLAYLYEALEGKTPDDVERYYNSYVRHAPRALYVIGKLSKSDIGMLARYGRVVMLKKEDLVRF